MILTRQQGGTKAAVVSAAVIMGWFGAVTGKAQTDPTLGDIDGDEVVTVRDLARLVGFIRGTAIADEATRSIADVNGDGALNALDREDLVRSILGTRDLESLPLCGVRATSPASGASDVAVTRETVLRFTCPLALDATIGPEAFFAQFGDRRILSRVELSGDRLKATLFYLEPLPSSARLRVTLDGSGLTDLLGRELDLDGDGTPGGAFRMQFDTLTTTPLTNTAISGQVFASELAAGLGGEPVDVPLAGVTITVDEAEETLRAVTGADGSFVLDPCPSGSFFVHIDGRTAPVSNWPDGGYYPSVGKKWYTEPGRTDNLAGDRDDTPTGATGIVYLPYVCPGTLQPVSATETTEISFPADVLTEFPELTGVKLDVPANALFSDDGTRGGKVGIAPVPAERLPGPLPPGLDASLVITIQTDGATNFDRPVPVQFPNLPDPLTGEPSPPGAPRSIASFNHDTGEWEIVGSATVSDDGNFIVSDPGSGILQPGWHLPPLPRTKVSWPGVMHFTDGGPTDDCGKRIVFVYELLKSAMKELQPLVAIEGIPDRLACAEAWLDNVEAIRIRAASTAHSLRVGNLDETELNVAIQEIGELLAAAEDASVCAVRGDGIYVAEEIEELLGGALAQLRFAKTAYNEGNGGDGCQLGGDLINLIDTAIELAEAASVDLEASALETDGLVDLFNALSIDDDPSQIIIFIGLNALGSEAEDLANCRSDIRGLRARIEATIASVELALNRVSGTLEGLTDRGSLPVYWALDLGTDDFETGDPDTIVLRGRLAPRAELFVFVAPNVPYVLNAFQRGPNGGANWLGRYPGVTKGNNQTTSVPRTLVLAEGQVTTDGAIESLEIDGETIELNGRALYRFTDEDEDTIPEGGEFVVGFDPNNDDTDGDETTDDNELKGRIPTLLGVIQSIENANIDYWDIEAASNLIVTANGANGFSTYDLGGDGAEPWRVRRLRDRDTSGSASAVSIGGENIAVAVGSAGLEIVPIPSLSSTTQPVRKINIPNSITTSVATLGDTAFVGSTNAGSSQLDVVDLPTGNRLPQAATSLGAGEVTDIAITRGVVYAALDLGSSIRLVALRVPAALAEGFLIANQLTIPMQSPLRGPRIGVANNRLYVSTRQSLAIVDISVAANPQLLTEPAVDALWWKQLAPVGSGLALGMASTALQENEPQNHSVYLYNLGSEEQLMQFLFEIPTEGIPQAVAFNNGYAYVADRGRGLKVINYLGFDTSGEAPTIALTSNFDLGAGFAEEGAYMWLSAQTYDDFQVLRVEFFVDGAEELIATDVTFPYEAYFTTPVGVDEFSVRAVAYDTAGKDSEPDEHTLTIVDDATPPLVLCHELPSVALEGSLQSIPLCLSELIDPVTFPDGFTATAIGTPVPFDVSFRPETKVAFLDFGGPLPAGRYRVEATTALKDPAGNALAAPYIFEFEVFSRRDLDEDGMIDALEAALGLDPTLADTDGDGILDGDEDFDGDGLINRGEIELGTDPTDADSDGDGIPDGDEDGDGDALSDGQEFLAGSDPRDRDSDDDGWSDEAELTAGSSPIDATSTPLLAGGGLYAASPTMVFHRQQQSDVLAPGVIATRDPAYAFHKQDQSDSLAAGLISTRATAAASGAPVRVLYLQTESDPLAPGVIDTRAGGAASGAPVRVLHLQDAFDPLARGTTSTIPWLPVPPTLPDP